MYHNNLARPDYEILDHLNNDNNDENDIQLEKDANNNEIVEEDTFLAEDCLSTIILFLEISDIYRLRQTNKAMYNLVWRKTPLLTLLHMSDDNVLNRSVTSNFVIYLYAKQVAFNINQSNNPLQTAPYAKDNYSQEIIVSSDIKEVLANTGLEFFHPFHKEVAKTIAKMKDLSPYFRDNPSSLSGIFSELSTEEHKQQLFDFIDSEQGYTSLQGYTHYAAIQQQKREQKRREMTVCVTYGFYIMAPFLYFSLLFCFAVYAADQGHPAIAIAMLPLSLPLLLTGCLVAYKIGQYKPQYIDKVESYLQERRANLASQVEEHGVIIRTEKQQTELSLQDKRHSLFFKTNNKEFSGVQIEELSTNTDLRDNEPTNNEQTHLLKPHQ